MSAAEVTAETDAPTLVVDRYQRGDLATIGRPSRRPARVTGSWCGQVYTGLYRSIPGLYREGLVIDKRLEVLGDGPVADIEIEARGTNALLFKGTIGRVANLTLRRADVGGSWFGVDITQGRA